MSYDLDRTIKFRCPCGEGQIVESKYSNDWFQSYENHSIMCENCNKRFHIEGVSWRKNDGELKTIYNLVPNGETLRSECNQSFNTNETPFYEILCMFSKKDDLEKGYVALREAKYFSRLEDLTAIDLCLDGKKYLGTVKPKIITPHVLEAIEKYDNVDRNFERYIEQSIADNKRIANVKSRSIGLYSLDEIN